MVKNDEQDDTNPVSLSGGLSGMTSNEVGRSALFTSESLVGKCLV